MSVTGAKNAQQLEKTALLLCISSFYINTSIVNSFDNKTLMKWIDCHVQHFLYKESALVDRFDALAIT